MKREEIIDTLQELAQKSFNQHNLSINDDTLLEDILGWNSLTHVMFIDSVEKRYNIKFSFSEMLGFSNIKAICDALMNQLS